MALMISIFFFTLGGEILPFFKEMVLQINITLVKSEVLRRRG